MEKYCIELIRGNCKRTMGTFDTKEEAFAFGKKIRSEHPGETGLFVCNGYQYAGDRRIESHWRQYMKW